MWVSRRVLKRKDGVGMAVHAGPLLGRQACQTDRPTYTANTYLLIAMLQANDAAVGRLCRPAGKAGAACSLSCQPASPLPPQATPSWDVPFFIDTDSRGTRPAVVSSRVFGSSGAAS